MNALELWIGPEASVARTADGRRYDQLAATGFAERLDDLDRLAALGAKAVRLPILWERTETQPGAFDFAWADARLQRCRELGLRPIVGLVHHGSGPAHTDLLDPRLPALLADYARRLAERHPWIEDWTPVNEPLTTARFAALYGFWWPGRRDDRAFLQALLHQVQAIGAAMRAVRAVQPAARLVQTEDLGHCAGTPALAEQVAFENERRWLSLDLLVGRVDASHPLHRWLCACGMDAAALDALCDAPTPPDVVGLNVYVTGERYLDHRVARYPRHLHGGNGRQRYADIEAVRVAQVRFGGFESRLREAWQRYALPLAVTEAHLGCSREEQMRWLVEAWRAAQRVAEEGAEVRAVTAWSAFGACDWDSLMTQRRDRYEPGLFDIRGRAHDPRPTALATLARELAAGSQPSHPVLAAPGWWRRPERQVFPSPVEPCLDTLDGPPLLVLGGRGTLAQAFARIAARRGIAHRVLARGDLDIADAAAVEAALARWQPWAVVNAAGYVRVDDAEHDRDANWRANAIGPAVLAAACERHGARLLNFSTDLVFDGSLVRPHVESDPARPLNAYGQAKADAEHRLAGRTQVLTVRTAAFFGPWDEANFVWHGLQRLRDGRDWPAVGDQTVTPTYVPDLVHASLDLLIDGEHGLWHLTNGEALTWYEFACRVAEAAGAPRRLVRRIDTAAAGQAALRPRYSALGSERGVLVPALHDAMQRHFDLVGAQAPAAAIRA